VGEEVEEGSVVVVPVLEEGEEGEVVVEEEEEEEANRQQPHWPPILPGMVSKEYHPPFSEAIPRCSTHLNKNGDCIEPPMLTTMT
jgi:hypothetical protein